MVRNNQVLVTMLCDMKVIGEGVWFVKVLKTKNNLTHTHDGFHFCQKNVYGMGMSVGSMCTKPIIRSDSLPSQIWICPTTHNTHTQVAPGFCQSQLPNMKEEEKKKTSHEMPEKLPIFGDFAPEKQSTFP